MNKKAISEIVSTVLIISVTVVAVGIVMAWVVPMIRNSLDSGQACLAAQSDVSIPASGSNCVKNVIDEANSSNSTGTVYVTVKKESNAEVILKGVQVLVSVNGSSYSNIVNDSNSTLPGLNEERTFEFTDARYISAEKVSIAPIVMIGKTSKTCKESQEVTLVPCV